MKRALGVIVFAALKACNVAFPKSGKSVFIPIWLGKRLNFHKLSPAVVLLFLRHIGCGRHALPFFVNKLKDRVRILSNFYFHALHNRKNSAQVKRLETEGYYA